jgi:hypothetical protein
MIAGHCLCGGVSYELTGKLPEYDGAIQLPAYCHCKMCQRATGSAFWVTTMAPIAQFNLKTGRNLITRYESSPGVFRSFCKVCGSNLFFDAVAEPNQLYIGLGTIDHFETPPKMHIFTADKAPWHILNDDLPKVDAYP